MKEKYELIGEERNITLGGLTVTVKILDYKTSYGRDRYLVTPVAGEGKVWVEKLEK